MMRRKTLILDYGIGNVRSMHNAVQAAGGEPVLSRRPEDIRNSAGLILPGVGAFAKGMENLERCDLVGILRDYASSGRHMMGVCLGMQMMMSRSFEFGETAGLDMFPGDVQPLAANAAQAIRLPHIGWTMLREPERGRWRNSVLDNGHDGPPSFYFVHSFAVVPLRPSEVLATASNGAGDFIAAIQRDNICGTQFHPEKSGPAGLALLSKFLKLCET